MHEIKSFRLQEIYEFDSSFYGIPRFVPKLRKFKKNGARKTFLTGSTIQLNDSENMYFLSTTVLLPFQ